MPRVGEPFPAMYGWTILAIREKCPKHGYDRYDFQGNGRSQKRRANICPLCWKERDKEYVKRRAYRRKEDMAVDLWSEDADEAIDRFWAARGMTEDDARAKFAPRFRIPVWKQ